MTRTVNVAALAALDPEELTRIIELNVSHADPSNPEGRRRAELWGALARPELIDDTFAALGRLLRHWEDAIALKKAELDAYQAQCAQEGDAGRRKLALARRRYSTWRQMAVATRLDVSRRYGEIKAVIYSYRSADGSYTPRGETTRPNPEKRKQNSHALFQLAAAVARHRDVMDEEGILPLPHDVELHQMLEQLVTLTSAGEITLDRWVEDITSRPDYRPDDVQVS